MGDGALAGRRVVVVGASAGIGRSFAKQAIEAGGDVVVSARRADVLAALVEEAGGGQAVAADVSVADDCRRLGAAVSGGGGPIDLVTFCVGVSPLKRIELNEQADWLRAFTVNVVGINLTIAALLPALAPNAVVAVLSSEAVGRPYWGLSTYAASKAALEESVRSWRIEHPAVRFITVPIGATAPTEGPTAYEQDALLEALDKWAAAGLQTEIMHTDRVAGMMLQAFAATLAAPGVGIDYLVLRGAAAQTGSSDVYRRAVAGNQTAAAP